MQSIHVVGSGSDKIAELLEPEAEASLALPDARSAILLSDEQIFSDVAPIYVREPDAKQSKQAS